MPESLAVIVVAAVTVYASAGLVFALAFAVRGVGAVDPRAAGSGAGFRALVVPGSVIFWPLLLRRWTRSMKRDA